jgi:hypothetical protein
MVPEPKVNTSRRLEQSESAQELRCLECDSTRCGTAKAKANCCLASNVSLANAASAARARFANPFPIFNPQGDLNLETQTICTLTQTCTDGDGHPSDAGYLALANIVFDVSGNWSR